MNNIWWNAIVGYLARDLLASCNKEIEELMLEKAALRREFLDSIDIITDLKEERGRYLDVIVGNEEEINTLFDQVEELNSSANILKDQVARLSAEASDSNFTIEMMTKDINDLEVKLLPYPLPKVLGTITKEEVRPMLAAALGWEIHASYIPLRDTEYKILYVNDILDFVRWARIWEYERVPEDFDCDDFVRALIGKFTLEKWGKFPHGLVGIKTRTGSYHAILCFIASDIPTGSRPVVYALDPMMKPGTLFWFGEMPYALSKETVFVGMI